MQNITSFDQEQMASFIERMPDTKSVTQFKESPEIKRLSLKFDIDELRKAVDSISKNETENGFTSLGSGFHAISLSRRPGATEETANDLSGRYYMRTDESMIEEPREDLVQEIEFSEFNSNYQGSYFEYVHQELSKLFPIGRMRILMKDQYNCNSWHRDPEPRLHIPIYTNPGSLFIVNHHCTHMPADGSVYFTDTRGYHMAVNGGETQRIHIVAALAYPPITE
ncbi:MAG: hypothetical protein COA74_01555 [Gammaproteobacteria bacterium]|nr:MAG: hypothetical protein COA74_01555 [Gammaproteobacteria bacterium]